MKKHYSLESQERDEEGSHFSAFLLIICLIGYAIYGVYQYTKGLY